MKTAVAHCIAKLLTEFIRNNYAASVVEVGCGRYSATAHALRSVFKVTATDILEKEYIDRRLRHIYVKNDITRPDLSLYRGANLIYSIRPPLEIQQNIVDLSEQLNADALIKPLGSEIIADRRLNLCNYRGLPFYLFRHVTFYPQRRLY
jgi:hypothetical protein